MGKMIGDLHCHSLFSDGSASPESIVSYAKRMGLNYIALTDHDTMAGFERAYEAGKSMDIHVLRAVECSTRDSERGRSVHMLCYLPRDYETLQTELNKTLQSRTATKTEMFQKLTTLYPITLEDVHRYSKESASIYESHIMQAIADLGYTNTIIGTLMDELISSKGTCYVPNIYPEVREIAKLINEVGGIAVIAHPGQFNSLELVEELAERRLIGGVECFHPRNSSEVTMQALLIAVKYGLIVTGGSDFHGQYAKNPHPIGACTTDQENIIRLLTHKSK